MKRIILILAMLFAMSGLSFAQENQDLPDGMVQITITLDDSGTPYPIYLRGDWTTDDLKEAEIMLKDLRKNIEKGMK